MRRDVTFLSQGLTCRGWLYTPDHLKTGERRPALVMAHGFAAVKEVDLPTFAERFAAAGLVSLVFDYRYFGESEGEPRNQLFPQAQLDDYRNAVTWLSLQPEVDPSRIGAWGTSFSGAHVLHLGAFDKRIKAVVAQVPNTSSWENAQQMMPPDVFQQMLSLLAADRLQRYTEGVVNYLPVSAPAGQPAVFSDPGTYHWSQQAKQIAPTFRSEITIESLERILEYAPGYTTHLITPTPLLMIVATGDVVSQPALAYAAYERAKEPKELVRVEGEHYVVYREPVLSHVAAHAVTWFDRYL
jgi:cephalosporin-C deacetylase-like acetyl esterase